MGTCALAAFAELDATTLNKTWGKGRYTRLGYAWTNTNGNNLTEDGKFSFFLSKGTTYYFPKAAPIGNILKIGVDATWFDAQVTKYKSTSSSSGSSLVSTIAGNLGDTGVDEETIDDVTSAVEDEIGIDPSEIGTWSLSLAMGIGPNVSIAPFALTNITILQPLRLSVYFHYDPTVMLYMKSEDDIEVSTAYVNMMDFGCNLQYRKLALGYEHRWGNGKFKPISFGEDSDDNRYTRDFASNRLYIQFTF